MSNPSATTERQIDSNLFITVSGPPGCGATTLTEGLAEALNCGYVIGGDIFRDLADENDFSVCRSNHCLFIRGNNAIGITKKIGTEKRQPKKNNSQKGPVQKRENQGDEPKQYNERITFYGHRLILVAHFHLEIVTGEG